MPSAIEAQLSEDEIVDLLYFARANEAKELKETVTSISKRLSISEKDVLKGAVCSQSQNTPLHYAAANGHEDILIFALSVLDSSSSHPHPSINAANEAGNTPLHWAALNGQLSAVKKLVAAGAQLDIKNLAGKDAIFEAHTADKEEVAAWLLSQGSEQEMEEGGCGEQEGDSKVNPIDGETVEKMEKIDIKGE